MLEDSKKHMYRIHSPGTPMLPTPISYETPAQPTPSIMNELEDAIITDLQVALVLQRLLLSASWNIVDLLLGNLSI